MIRYFISYKNLINDNKLDRKLDIYSPELKVMKKNKNGTYRVEPILYFTGYANDLLSYAEKINYNKKGIMLMVELSSEEVKQFNPLTIKSFETDEKNINLLKPKKEKVRLINYRALVNMNIKELESGTFHKIVAVKNVPNNSELFYIDDNFDKVLKNNNTYKIREELIHSKLGSDIYYYTDDENVLERYKDETTVLEETEPYAYKLIEYRLFIIDSIPQERIYDLNNATLRYLYALCNSALQVNISEKEDGTYSITNYKIDKRKKKAYIILEPSFKNYLYDSSLVPLLKYINIYELNKENYEKINIEEYMKDKNILKYIKKPSKN